MSLEEVRREIDVIDAQIVALLGQRQPLVLQAAQFKRDAPKRRAEMAARLTELAEEHGLAPKLVLSVFDTMVDEFIEIQRQHHAVGQ
ncbi:chorismate mutase [Nocardia sp. NPDC058666]|uniref:chorismate mutase n=1 Tax=Nocardia sp. NPDC058666 TaxID=3346587 RepID=UPI003656D83B